jgi:hypothetical protein
MNGLNEIIARNEPKAFKQQQAKARLLNGVSRDCSFASSDRGTVLHSAGLRSTQLLTGAKEISFLRDAGKLLTRGAKTELNQLIESYFV